MDGETVCRSITTSKSAPPAVLLTSPPLWHIFWEFQVEGAGDLGGGRWAKEVASGETSATAMYERKISVTYCMVCDSGYISGTMPSGFWLSPVELLRGIWSGE